MRQVDRESRSTRFPSFERLFQFGDNRRAVHGLGIELNRMQIRLACYVSSFGYAGRNGADFELVGNLLAVTVVDTRQTPTNIDS